MKNSKHHFKTSLFLKFAFILIAVTTVSLIISLRIYRENITKLLTVEVEKKATIFLSGLEGSVRGHVTGRGVVVPLSELLDIKAEFFKEHLTFNIIRAAVVNPHGRILDHTIPDRIGQTHMSEDFKRALTLEHPLLVREIKTLKREPGSPEIPVIKIYYPVYGRNSRAAMGMIIVDLDVERTFESIQSEYSRFNRRVIMGFVLTTVLLVISILFFLKRRIINPVAAVARASENVARGQMQLLPVVSGHDEMARLIQSFNHMVEGLKQRDQMRVSLELAREVQQNLLPKNDPTVEGLDIAGQSIYCDSTGGDYYDYLVTEDSANPNRIMVVVGDVSDHGIQSALLMATARSALHQHWMHDGSLDLMLAAVNRQLVLDVEDSGYFMTMFLAQIDCTHQLVRWANAGHDPALVYDRHADVFDELTGRGLALGVEATTTYEQWQRNITNGQIFIIGTDGIWEACSRDGDLYGKDRFKTVIRENASASAHEIVAAIIHDVENFMSQPLEDDITVTVIKVDGV